MKIKMYQVDAFTNALFKGNPAAVIVGPSWLDDGLMKNLALENNLSETGNRYPSTRDHFRKREFIHRWSLQLR